MKKIFSIICIIFLIGITSVVPIYSTSYFVYAAENNEQLTDDEIIQAGLAVYLNTRNGFITIANGTVNGAKVLMNNTIDTFIDYYNVNHTIQEQISKSSLVANILVNYNPFRVSLKGSAVSFFNSLYSYLEDEGKVPNASNSNGGETSDNLYAGKIIGNSLFYIVNDPNFYFDRDSFKRVNSQYMEAIGTPVNGCNSEFIYSQYINENPNIDFSNNQYQNNHTKYISCTYSANITKSFPLIYAYSGGTSTDTVNSNGGVNSFPAILADGQIVVYSSRVNKIRGNTAWIINRNNPTWLCPGIVAYDYNNDKYLIKRLDYYTNVSGVSNETIDFETTDFDDQPMDVPEGNQEVELTPKDSDNNQTFNTYNEYINNYVIKKTYITNNNSGGGNDDPTNPTNPSGGTVPDWSGGGGSGTITPDGNGGYTFELPDFSLPDLDIDWSISGLTEKFPFSIPFDLLAFFTVLNAEPETPEIEATIPLGLWEWEIDWDLHNFDTLAALLRNLEFIGFCIGLALITRNIIKG